LIAPFDYLSQWLTFAALLALLTNIGNKKGIYSTPDTSERKRKLPAPAIRVWLAVR